MDTNLCKHESHEAQCRSKECNCKQPEKPDCREGNSCARENCRYNHQIQACRFGTKCTISKSKCNFRHPLGSAKKMTDQDFRKNLKSTKNHPENRHKRPSNSNTKNNWNPEPVFVQSPIVGVNVNKHYIGHNFNPSHQKHNAHQGTSSSTKTRNEVQQNLDITNSTVIAVALPSAFIAPKSGHKSSKVKTNLRKQASEPQHHPVRTHKKSLDSTHSQPTKAKPGTMNSLELKAIEDHKTLMKSVSKEIISLTSSDDFDINDEKSKGTVEAMKKRYSELSLQLLAYEKIRSRAVQTLTNEDLNRQLKRELYRFKSRLPALAARPEIENLIESNTSRFLIIQGQTGSGKSTQVAQYIADHPKFKDKKIICTQPRKIAAISLASRVSMEYSGGFQRAKPGHEIGFHVGGKKVGGKWCRIEFVTEGVMLERIMKGSAESFKDVGCIVIDEAHERSIICDILLGLFREEDPRWKDIRVIVTSATIDLLEFSKFFKRAPTVEIEGKIFPVDLVYNPVPENCEIRTEVVKCALNIHKSCKKNPGDILCFLPGQEDVLSAKAAFEMEIGKVKANGYLEAEVFSLYGRQEPEQQSQVFEKLPSTKRKIIFATDVAETSITIDGIVYVVDSGVKKEIVFDPKRNISSLRVNTISISSAIQRAGRSGRTQPGQCYRLYSKDDFETMSFNTAPEIFRRPLSLAILSLREMNIDPLTFGWISAPSKDAFASADEELRYLRAVDSENHPTDLGKLITQSQHEPKLVRMIYRGCQDGIGMAAITVASILTVSNMFFWNGIDAESKAKSKKHRLTISDPDGDIVTMFRLFEQWLQIRDGSVDLPVATNCPARLSLSIEELANDDASDTVSVISEVSESRTVSICEVENICQETQTRKNGRKEAADWCRNNFVNGKALGLVLSTRSELLSLFKHTQIWKQNNTQFNNPSNKQLKRLVFSGFFLHSARLIHSKNTRTRQYFAIHPDVLGNLDFRAAILNHKGATEADFTPPIWIIYDKILRLKSTLFPTTSPIEESWIKEESEEFYEFCTRKSQTLPTERVFKKVSQECLKSIVGKFFSNLNSLEREVDCLLEVDIESGILAAYCSLSKKNRVEMAIKAKIDDVLRTMGNQVIEEDYLGGTRLVLGQGYEVKDVLFPQEYTTIYIRNLPADFSKTYLHHLLNQLLRDSKEKEIIRTIEVTQHDTNASAVIRFFSKHDAKAAFERLKGEMIQGQVINVTPTGLGPKRGITQGESCRLKISWAIGNSTGKADISFTSPSEANSIIQKIDLLFPGSRVSRVHGELNANLGLFAHPVQINQKGKKPLPPAMYTGGLGRPRRGIGGQQNIRFITGLEENQDLEYRITIVDLNKSIDEQEIVARVRPSIPKWVKVYRDSDPVAKSACENGLIVEDRTKKLQPIQKYIDNHTVTLDFFDKNLCRAGIYVHFNDKLAIQKAYRGSDYFALGDMFGQPHRMEVEYTHATSIHVDLYKFLKSDIDDIRSIAYKKGVNASELFPKPNSKSTFVTLKFRSSNANLIQNIQEKLEELSNSTKFICEKIELLFTWTGRIKLMELANKTFLHWNNRTHGIWIYGSPEVQKEVAKDLNQIVDHLKALEVFDKPFMLNKKKVDLNGKQGDKMKHTLTRICNSCNLAYYHFNGNKIFASGSTECVDMFEKALEKNQFLFKKLPSKLASQNNGRIECGLCFCPTDGRFILTSLCGHAFCMECIQPMFDMQPPEFPIKCQECQALLVINDILKCAPQSSLRKFLEVGVFQYQEKHAEEVLICPKPGCNQLFSYGSRRNGEFGGDFYFCDECVTTYCMTCSIKVGKPLKSHEHDTCNDAQNGPSDAVARHVKEIQEKTFNLACPRCQTVFFEFIGCAAVTCETCKCAFCGLCLKDCGNDAHSHVKACVKNPRQGEYFISEGQLNQIHRQIRVQKIREYLQDIQDLEVRNGIYRAIRRDLIDLCIDGKEIGF